MSATLLGFLLRRHRLSCLLCGMAPLFIGSVVGLVYPSYSEMREVVQVFKFATRFFGQGQMDLFTPAGAFSLPFQHPLCLAVFAVLPAIPAMALPAGERGRGALDLLLASPLDRKSLILTVAGFQGLLAPWAAVCACSGAGLGAALAGVSSELPWGRFVVVAINAASLLAFFGGLSLVASVLAPDRSAAMLGYGVIVFGSFMVDVTARLWPEGDWLAWLTPFGYLRPADVVSPAGRAAAGWGDAAVLLAGALILGGTAVVLQIRRRSA